MGMMGFGWSDEGNYHYNPVPNPYNFKINKATSLYGMVALEVNYPSCTTFNGNKIMVYDDVNVVNRKSLDPHFLGSNKDPIARFPATEQGWKDALTFMRNRNA